MYRSTSNGFEKRRCAICGRMIVVPSDDWETQLCSECEKDEYPEYEQYGWE